MQSVAYITKQDDQFICSVVAQYESSNYVYSYDRSFPTLFDALTHALLIDKDTRITLDPYCEAIAYLVTRAYLESNARMINADLYE